MRGFDVDMACKNQGLSDLINSDGLIFRVKKRRHIQFITAYPSVSATPGGYDYVLLATKSFDIEPPTQDVLEKITSQSLIVSLQDGYCEEKLARIAGTNRVVGTVITWGATLNPDGIAVMSSGGDMTIGKLDGSDDPRLDNLQYLLNFIAPTRVVSNINEHIFSKLIINSCVTTLGAISGLKIGALITDRNMRNIFIKILQEGMTIANAIKFKIPEFAGRLNYYRFIRGNSLYHRVRKHLFIRMFGIKYRKVKSSGLQSLERGEKTEIEFLNGYFLTKGKEMGIDLPVNKRLVELVNEIENRQRKISPKNLHDPLFRLK
jgi:2-dehydropantoate 2-reductase